MDSCMPLNNSSCASTFQFGNSESPYETRNYTIKHTTSVREIAIRQQAFPNDEVQDTVSCLIVSLGLFSAARLRVFVRQFLQASMVKQMMHRAAMTMKISILELMSRYWAMERMLMAWMKRMTPLPSMPAHPLSAASTTAPSPPSPMPTFTSPALLSWAGWWPMRCSWMTFCICCSWLKLRMSSRPPSMGMRLMWRVYLVWQQAGCRMGSKGEASSALTSAPIFDTQYFSNSALLAASRTSVSGQWSPRRQLGSLSASMASRSVIPPGISCPSWWSAKRSKSSLKRMRRRRHLILLISQSSGTESSSDCGSICIRTRAKPSDKNAAPEPCSYSIQLLLSQTGASMAAGLEKIEEFGEWILGKVICSQLLQMWIGKPINSLFFAMLSGLLSQNPGLRTLSKNRKSQKVLFLIFSQIPLFLFQIHKKTVTLGLLCNSINPIVIPINNSSFLIGDEVVGGDPRAAGRAVAGPRLPPRPGGAVHRRHQQGLPHLREGRP